MLPGGWMINPDLSPCKLPKEVEVAFSEAVGGLDGSGYIPVLYCGSQVVTGVNYMLICKQTPVVAQPEDHLVIMMINKPSGEKAKMMFTFRLI